MAHYRTINLDHPVYPPHIVAALADALVEEGVVSSRVLSGTGLISQQLRVPQTRVSYRQILAVLRNAVVLAGSSDLILRAGRRMNFAAYGVVGYTVMSSPSHSDAADRAVRFSRVIGPLCSLDFHRDNAMAIWVYEPIFWSDPTDPMYQAAVEFHMASHLTVLSNLYGANARVSELRLAYHPGPRLTVYEQLFGCPVVVNQPRNEFRHGAHLMDLPMPYSDATTHASVREMCERHLAKVLGGDNLTAEVHRRLLDHEDGFPSVEKMAEMMSLNARTLRRRLEAEGTSYREIVAEVRKQMALTYLRTTSLKHEQIAAQLGYSDAANFRHAFLRWTGRNPSEFRQR